MTNRFVLLALAGVVAIPLTAAGASSVPKADRQFIAEAASGGQMEVELGRMAADKASSDRVKQFGQRMVDDHAKANDELKDLAGKKAVTLPAKVSDKQRKTIDRLARLKGAEFDHAYMQMMLQDHVEDVGKFRKESQSAKDPDVKAFAAKTLPTLEEHLQMAKDITGSGGATSGTRAHGH